MKDHVIEKLNKEVAGIMCDANNRYKSFVSYDNGKKVAYMRLLKTLYRCM